LPSLLRFPAKCRFLSCEPLLGRIDLGSWASDLERSLHPIDWVIAGGESGPNARPMLPGWAISLRDQCRKCAIPFHFKQWGHWAPVRSPQQRTQRVQAFWDEVMGIEVFMEAKGKRIAGRRLDGATWDQLPLTA